MLHLRVDVGVLAVADHLGALGHVALEVVVVRLQEGVDRRLQDSKKGNKF
jgi:hypothetical protein